MTGVVESHDAGDRQPIEAVGSEQVVSVGRRSDDACGYRRDGGFGQVVHRMSFSPASTLGKVLLSPSCSVFNAK